MGILNKLLHPKQLRPYQLPPLMDKYVPEMPLIVGPFGGLNWGESYGSSYTWEGAVLFLVPKLLKRIEELEAQIEKRDNGH